MVCEEEFKIFRQRIKGQGQNTIRELDFASTNSNVDPGKECVLVSFPLLLAPDSLEPFTKYKLTIEKVEE